tara:strand:+ start:39241 stop:40323 length:1083 start_codon:yes stop_codon:yes gene_type:complete
MCNQKTDDLDPIGYIDKNTILKYISQEEIFSLVFDFEPEEFQYVTSPFRVSDDPRLNDNNPGCWFEYYNNKLRFKDFGNPSKYGRIKMKNIDCFDAIQVSEKLNNLYEVLSFIKAKLIDGKEYQGPKRRELSITNVVKKHVLPVKIFVSTRGWQNRDGIYWSKYGISKANLIEDKVFPIQKLKLKNTKKGDFTFNVGDLGYAYTDFGDSHRKIYRPYQKNKKYKFVTNCNNDDIGDFKRLVSSGRQLVISKSYKDCRVLRNLGLNVVWFQNEGQTPDKKALKDLCSRFDKVVVFFDNDDTGIKASQEVAKTINKLFEQPKATFLYLPEELRKLKITDPADLFYRKGERVLKDYLTEKRLI